MSPKRVSLYLAAAAAFLWAFSAALPDGAPGSPRSLAIAGAGGLTAASVLLRGGLDASTATTP